MLRKKIYREEKWSEYVTIVVFPTILIVVAFLPVSLFAQDAEYRHFKRTPYLTGPDDPERGQIRDTLMLGETVIIETPGVRDADYEMGVVPELAPRRNSRPGGPFFIEGVEPGDWLAIHIIAIEMPDYGFVNNGGPWPLTFSGSNTRWYDTFPPRFRGAGEADGWSGSTGTCTATSRSLESWRKSGLFLRWSRKHRVYPVSEIWWASYCWRCTCQTRRW